ncbi:sulfatase-like hydrolase/transferase [bacterium]|nr:sulfatase-like hydrolase/transferase [bacterium]
MHKHQNRRKFFATTALGAAGLTLPLARAASQETRQAQKRPNVVLIMADDIGRECFGCYGSEQYKTPHLDRLARDGARFTHCHANPLCTPSRVKIMTGQSNIRNYHTFGILQPGQTTFGNLFKQAGYRTAVVGKWQLYGAEHMGNMAGKGTHPTEAGFDEYCLWHFKSKKPRYWNPGFECNGKEMQIYEGKYGPDILCEYATDFIERNKEQPFLLYYPMVLTHSPFPPTPHSKDPKSKNTQKNFEDMVAYMDTIIGRITKKLEECGVRENTLLIFTGDNGSPRQIRSRLEGRTIQGGKSLSISDGTRVPMIVNQPGTVKSGNVCGDLVDFSDVLPTITEAAGIPLPQDRVLDGRSFYPQLQGKKGNPREAVFIYNNPRPLRENYVAHQNPTHRFALDKRWKLYGNGRLYDMKNDVMEKNPIMPGEGNKEAQAARKKLQAVIDSMPKEPQMIKKK